jgi:DNA-binding NtrC family response regulator
MGLNRFGYTLAEIEREHIIETLTCHDGNRTRTAKSLDISVRCLRMKLQQFAHSGAQASDASLCPDSDDDAVEPRYRIEHHYNA